MRETNKDTVAKDYLFKFMDHHICKPMKKGFEDLIQCQSNTQEMQLQSENMIIDMELKMDNANAHSEAQMQQLEG